jgi:type I restriction enzyme R subunit
MELVGVVEAKNQSKNALSVLDQAKEYSQIVQKHSEISFPNHSNSKDYKVPFMFSTNGRPCIKQVNDDSGILFWDGRKATNNPKALTEWYSPNELQDLLEFDNIPE